MRIIKSRTLLSILLFTTCTTITLLLCMYAFIYRPQVSSISYNFKLIQSSDVYTHTQANENTIISSNDMDAYYSQQFQKNFPYLVLSIVSIISLSAIALWLWMRKLERLKHRNIASTIQQLQSIELHESDEFYYELEQIKDIMNAYQEDQQRLHAYIMHEQKNTIMLLKARLKKEQDPQLYADIDQLTYSVDDVLTLFARADSERESIDLAYIVAYECDQYRQLYPSLSFSFDEDKSYTMLGKAYWLHRTIANLLDNAIKYGNSKPIEVLLKQEKNTIILQVIDHGIGMDKQQIDHIFAYRYRIQNLKKDGFGIGLSLVAHTCELCDGVIWVKSTPQKGSVFHLSFPLLT